MHTPHVRRERVVDSGKGGAGAAVEQCEMYGILQRQQPLSLVVKGGAGAAVGFDLEGLKQGVARGQVCQGCKAWG